jgi:hypothetical protein
MPYKIQSNGDGTYRVLNVDTRHVFSYFTSLDKAKKQVRFLKYVDHMKRGGSFTGHALNVNALISEESYKAPDKREPEIMGYIYSPANSTAKVATYINPQFKHIAIAHRGTDVHDKNDLKNDALLLIGQITKSQRFKNALELARKIEKEYPDYTIINVGHSLGGKYAAEVGKKLKITNSKVETFNMGTSPLEIPSRIYDEHHCKNNNSDKCQRLKNQINNVTGIDPISISALASSSQVRYSAPKTFNVHSLSNFSK